MKHEERKPVGVDQLALVATYLCGTGNIEYSDRVHAAILELAERRAKDAAIAELIEAAGVVLADVDGIWLPRIADRDRLRNTISAVRGGAK